MLHLSLYSCKVKVSKGSLCYVPTAYQLDQARSNNRVLVWLGQHEWSEVVVKINLGRHHTGYLPEYFWHVTTNRVAKQSRSDREAIVYWSSRRSSCSRIICVAIKYGRVEIFTRSVPNYPDFDSSNIRSGEDLAAIELRSSWGRVIARVYVGIIERLWSTRAREEAF